MRRISAEARINSVWVLLSGLTILGWGLAKLHGEHRLTPSGPETMAVLAIAGVKGRLIVQHYMEVRTAPRWLRRAIDGWLVVLLGALAVMYASA